MTDRSYDALVVGGGHHGTIIACYLARVGLSVGVLEREARLGRRGGSLNCFHEIARDLNLPIG